MSPAVLQLYGTPTEKIFLLSESCDSESLLLVVQSQLAPPSARPKHDVRGFTKSSFRTTDNHDRAQRALSRHPSTAKADIQFALGIEKAVVQKTKYQLLLFLSLEQRFQS